MRPVTFLTILAPLSKVIERPDGTLADCSTMKFSNRVGYVDTFFEKGSTKRNRCPTWYSIKRTRVFVGPSRLPIKSSSFLNHQKALSPLLNSGSRQLHSSVESQLPLRLTTLCGQQVCLLGDSTTTLGVQSQGFLVLGKSWRSFKQRREDALASREAWNTNSCVKVQNQILHLNSIIGQLELADTTIRGCRKTTGPSPWSVGRNYTTLCCIWHIERACYLVFFVYLDVLN